MKGINEIILYKYKINILKYDFMGYDFKLEKELSFHHLIIPKRQGGKKTLENGSLLVQNTSHNYLHTIEKRDEEIYNLITKEMIEENLKGKLDIENLKKIRDLLLYFEKEHYGDTNNKGNPLIKEEYIRRRIKL